MADDITELVRGARAREHDDLDALCDAIERLQAERDELRAFKDSWDEHDGNTPGYNLQKARTYGRKAFEYKTERDRLREALGRIVSLSRDDVTRWDAAEAFALAARALAGD